MSKRWRIKRSNNVPQTFRYLIGMNKKRLSSLFFPEFVLSKEILSIWPRRADSGQNRNDLFSISEIWERYQNVLVSFPKRYRNVCPFVFDITTKMLVRVAKRMKKKKDPICETSKLKMVDYLASVPPKMWSWDWAIFNVVKRQEIAMFWPIWSQHIPGPRADSLFMLSLGMADPP